MPRRGPRLRAGGGGPVCDKLPTVRRNWLSAPISGLIVPAAGGSYGLQDVQVLGLKQVATRKRWYLHGVWVLRRAPGSILSVPTVNGSATDAAWTADAAGTTVEQDRPQAVLTVRAGGDAVAQVMVGRGWCPAEDEPLSCRRPWDGRVDLELAGYWGTLEDDEAVFALALVGEGS